MFNTGQLLLLVQIWIKQLNFTFATFINCFKPSNSHYRYQVKLSRDIGKPSYSSKYVNTT